MKLRKVVSWFMPRAKIESAPRWAEELAVEVLSEEDRCLEYPEIQWVYTNELTSHGWCNNEGIIRIYSGQNIDADRLVLLHELAHHICGAEDGHSEIFWYKLFELQMLWADDIDPVEILRECVWYKKRSLKVALEIDWPGAVEEQDRLRERKRFKKQHDGILSHVVDNTNYIEWPEYEVQFRDCIYCGAKFTGVRIGNKCEFLRYGPR